MSGLAEILIDRGFTVSGSDQKPSPLTTHLEELGAIIHYPQAKENITPDISLVVYTAAIHPDNPELAAARDLHLVIISRAELLGAMMEYYHRSVAIAGTHGKTTTTSMLASVLLQENADPTISVGGILPQIQSNIRLGHSDIFVTEACEYTNSFLSFYPRYSIILNIEEDHLDFFKDIDDIRSSFRRFMKNTAEDGIIIINGEIDHLKELTEGISAKIVTFGFSNSCDFYPTQISYDEKSCASFTPVYRGEELEPITLSVPGHHNIGNALAVIALCQQLEIQHSIIASGLASFTGASRRFEYKGTYHGATIIDDYAHHPTEIAASLSAAEKVSHKRLIVVFQPHTYTRTRAFLDSFAEALKTADIVILAKIFAAREQDIYGVSSEDIRKRLTDAGVESYYFDTFEEIEKYLQKNLVNGDLLITMGAGDVVKVGEDLLSE